MHRFDTVLFEPGFEGQVEIRGIDTDEYIRLVRQQSITQGCTNPHDLAVAPQQLPAESVYRQLVVRPPGVEALLGHLRAADSARRGGRPACTHAGKQQAR